MIELVREIKIAKVGNRSNIKAIFNVLSANVDAAEIADLTLEVVIWSFNAGTPLTNTLATLGHQLFERIKEDNKGLSSEEAIKLGAVYVDCLITLGLIAVDEFPVIENNAQPTKFLSIIDEGFRATVDAHKMPRLKANLGYIPWEKPVMHIGGRKMDIIKKARRNGLLHNYRYDQIPDRYNTLNRLAQTEWKINKRMLDVLDVEADEDKNFIPYGITDYDKKVAHAEFCKTRRTAVWIEQVKFDELVSKGKSTKDAKGLAKYEAEQYSMKKTKAPLDIISKWSKERDFRKCINYAREYGDDTLNFIYAMCSRGRAYVINQATLNPQGPDAAKALLCFANPKQVSTWDLKITLANHAGEDKISYDDRIKWVDMNESCIIEVGRDPWSADSVEFMQDTGIATEKKSKFQFIAAAMAYADLVDWVQDGNDPDEFLCDIPVAYDATNSGLQILSAIGRDEYIAPYVNITATEQPGDVYQLIGTAVAKKNPVQKLTDVLTPEDKAWRSICKRNVMTKNYAATRYGMGTQQWEDKPDKKDDDTEVWHTLTFSECRKLGEVTYDTCSEYLEKASELMEVMKVAANHNEKAVITWRLPDGFLAFQAKPKFDEDVVNVYLGGKRIRLVIKKPTDEADKRAHASAISPDVVHSFDAWLLSIIVNGLPITANLAFVHDAFGSDSIHGADIQDVARDAYYQVSSRDVMSIVLQQIAGQPIELPDPGDWKLEELLTAEYIVC